MDKATTRLYSYFALSLILLYRAATSTVPTVWDGILAAVLLFLPDVIWFLHRNGVFYAIMGLILRPQVKKFLAWLNENADWSKTEIDFKDAPWLPRYLRAYYVRLGTALQMQRAMDAKKKPHRKKKPRKRRVAGKE